MPTFDGGHYFLTVARPDPDRSGARTTRSRRRPCTPCANASAFCRPPPERRVSAAPQPVRAERAHPFRPLRDRRRRRLQRARRSERGSGDARGSGSHRRPAAGSPDLSFPAVCARFRRRSGADEERDSYLVELWNVMERDLRQIFRFCVGFDAKVKDAASFAAYIAACQIETTMSFNDYYAEPPALPSWRTTAFRVGVFASAGALGGGRRPHSGLAARATLRAVVAVGSALCGGAARLAASQRSPSSCQRPTSA